MAHDLLDRPRIGQHEPRRRERLLGERPGQQLTHGPGDPQPAPSPTSSVAPNPCVVWAPVPQNGANRASVLNTSPAANGAAVSRCSAAVPVKPALSRPRPPSIASVRSSYPVSRTHRWVSRQASSPITSGCPDPGSRSGGAGTSQGSAADPGSGYRRHCGRRTPAT
jgi:hypothetical protein